MSAPVTAIFVKRENWRIERDKSTGLFRWRQFAKHRAEDFAWPLTVDKIRERTA